MSNETERQCLKGKIDYVKRMVKRFTEQINEIRAENPDVSIRPSGINEQIQKHEGTIKHLKNALNMLELNEQETDHIHIDKEWIPETEYSDKVVTFADMDQK